MDKGILRAKEELNKLYHGPETVNITMYRFADLKLKRGTINNSLFEGT